ncbi:hypothetical protein B0H13DRAFT_2518779 [Mycena leptocephala]|nr:hypothetical protein B0H13DRAFT_2518779 [Mycena leptocephala]
MSQSERRYCSTCKTNKSADGFHLKPDGTRKKTCIKCNERTAAANRKHRTEAKENLSLGDDQEGGGTDLSVLPLKDFLDALTEQGDHIELEALVNISSISGSRRDRADELAKAIWKTRSYRFVYVD